ncbi:MAG: AI-2E family transporter [Cyclobacteriaceae bacterium]|jgi:predicted PurR-regulated permease PerM|nr:AI-2E family transporter [Cyclobacteriaceae bacterium]
MEKVNFNRLDYIFKTLSILCIVGFLIIWAQDIIIPFAFASFFAVIILPLVRWLESKKFSTIWATILVIVVFTGLLVLSVWLIVEQLIALVNDLPDLQSRFDAFVLRSSGFLQELGLSISDQNKILKEATTSLSTYAANVLVSTSNVVSLLVQVPIYIFLFLIYRDKFKLFFQALLNSNQEMVWKKEVETVLKGYVSGLAIVTIIIAILNSIGLAVLGIEHAIFFGILSGILTVIPYVGIFIGAAFPVIVALITKDSAWYALGVIIIFSVVQFLEGNFITPKITGSKVSINALAAILALLIGSKLMGIAGMILAVPAIGVVKILIQYSEHLKPWAILLDDSNGQSTTVTDEPKLESPIETDKKNSSEIPS